MAPEMENFDERFEAVRKGIHGLVDRYLDAETDFNTKLIVSFIPAIMTDLRSAKIRVMVKTKFKRLYEAEESLRSIRDG